MEIICVESQNQKKLTTCVFTLTYNLSIFDHFLRPSVSSSSPVNGGTDYSDWKQVLPGQDMPFLMSEHEKIRHKVRSLDLKCRLI